ncbi:hypothetical protein N9C83_00225 [Opitutales bacterium]|nr:hypothetical protein [Opitutales bacterium]
MKTTPLISALIILLASILVSGCYTTTSLRDETDPDIFASLTEEKLDEDTGFSYLNGPSLKDPPNGRHRRYYKLKGTIEENGNLNVQLVLSDRPDAIRGFFHYHSAETADGTELELVQLDRIVKTRSVDPTNSDSDLASMSDSLSERVGMATPLDYLKEQKYQGLKVKVEGKRTTAFLYIPPTYVSGFLSKFENYL